MTEAQSAVRVASPRPIEEPVRRDVRRAVAAVGARPVADRMLSQDPAVWELTLASAGLPRGVVRREILAARPDLDVYVAPLPDSAGRRLVVLDVDSTLIQHEVIELIAEHAGTRAEVAAVTAAAMRGELDFTASLRSRVATLEGLDAGVLHTVAAAIQVTPGARTLVAALHARGHCVGVVSGGFEEILTPLVAELGLDHHRANRLEVRDGRLTGRVSGSVVDRAEKAAALRRWRAEDGVHPDDVVAVGDGANDLDMIAAAGLGVAFCAKPALRRAADTTLSFPRLDMVLHFLGLTDAEVAAALVGSGVSRGR